MTGMCKAVGVSQYSWAMAHPYMGKLRSFTGSGMCQIGVIIAASEGLRNSAATANPSAYY